ncbi:type VII secretion protein EccC [Nesterenkonia flava]
MGFIALIPLLGAGASMTVMMLFRGSPFAAVGALMMIVAVLGAVVMLFTQRGKAARRRRTMRDMYLEYLEDQRHVFLTEERTHRERAQASDPLPEALFTLIENPHRLWERRRGHEDFLRIRFGTGTAPIRRIVTEDQQDAAQRVDANLQQQLDVLVTRFSQAPNMPLLLSLSRHHTISVVGDEEFGRQVVLHLLLSATALHSPEDLQVAACVPEDLSHDWHWLDLLPHILDQSRPSGYGPLPRIAPTMEDLRDLLHEEISSRYQRFAELRKNFLTNTPRLGQARMFVLDMEHGRQVKNLPLPDSSLTSDDLAITAVHLVPEQRDEPDLVSLRISQTDGGFRIEDYTEDPLNPATLTGVLTHVPLATAEGLARQLAPLRLSPDSMEHDDDVTAERFTTSLGLRDFSRHDLDRLWKPRQAPDFLNVPIGTDEDGRPVRLDLKESAQHGMGPHGLCIGATGSGKSELLRTLVLALAVTHPPEELNMVLVDYKGGATFAPFEGIPHVAGIVTNLVDDSSLVDRIYSSLEGEVLRRQSVLKEAGNIANITDYHLLRREQLRSGEQALPPLPHLFVVIDEFGELLTAQPDFIDLFMSIGRIGRSIGVHLLLSSQRIESGKLRGLETHLSYRLGLRTLSEGESRTVLDTPDAFHLPPAPGYGYLKVDTTTYTRFRAGYVSGPLSEETQAPQQEGAHTREPVPAPFYAERALEMLSAQERDESAVNRQRNSDKRPNDPTVLSTIVELMREADRATPPIWLPPLPDELSLDQVFPHGLPGESSASQPAAGEALRIPIGLLDDPAKQWQGVWKLSLSRSGGHLMVLGAPSTGKSLTLRTIALSLAMTHSVRQVSLYGIDLKGSSLVPLDALPHSAGFTGRTAREAVRRTVEEVSDLLEEREQIFEQRGIDSLETMRTMMASGALEEIDVADVVLFIDGWGALAEDFAEIQESVHSILARGGSYGIHIITTATRWNEVRLAQQSFFGNRLELRLTEPSESGHGRKVAQKVPENRPGRGLDPSGLLGQIALPRLDGLADRSNLGEGLEEAAARVAEKEQQRTSRRVRLLPQTLSVDQLPAPSKPGEISFGLIERDLSPKMLDITGPDTHLQIIGDEQCGKTSLLKHVAATLVEQYSPKELVFAIFDPRRRLQNLVPEDYLGGYANSAVLAQKLAGAVSKELAGRVPDDPLTAARSQEVPLPRIVLLVDDYDVLSAGGTSPLAAFSEYLAMGAEIGLHSFVTRKTSGAARGMFDQFSGAVRDAGGAVFLMDGDRSEGPIVGNIRARHQPPGRGLFIRTGRTPETIHTVLREEFDEHS